MATAYEQIFPLANRRVSPAPSDSRSNALTWIAAPWNVAVLGEGVKPLVTVEAGDIVLLVANHISTTVAGGQTPGVEVGDDGLDHRFVTSGTTTGTTYVTPYAYSADNTIDLTVAAGSTSGIGVLFVLVYRP